MRYIWIKGKTLLRGGRPVQKPCSRGRPGVPAWNLESKKVELSGSTHVWFAF